MTLSRSPWSWRSVGSSCRSSVTSVKRAKEILHLETMHPGTLRALGGEHDHAFELPFAVGSVGYGMTGKKRIVFGAKLSVRFRAGEYEVHLLRQPPVVIVGSLPLGCKTAAC